MIVTPNAVLVRPEQVHARSRAEAHALAFLARYRVPQTRSSYGLSLRQWFRWCGDNGIDPVDATRAQIEIFARELEATGRRLATVASKLNALAGFYRYAVIDGRLHPRRWARLRGPKARASLRPPSERPAAGRGQQ
ncbi:MAG: site-specific integrase [Acidimicrobiales bacterium]